MCLWVIPGTGTTRVRRRHTFRNSRPSSLLSPWQCHELTTTQKLLFPHPHFHPLKKRFHQAPYFPSQARPSSNWSSDAATSSKNIPTIYALSTAPGKAGVAVVRISGPQAKLVLRRMIQPLRPTANNDSSDGVCVELRPRYAYYRRITHPTSGETLDHGLALYFPQPHSFTGEDVVELHIHGGVAVMQAVLGALELLPGFRMAERGEFTRRAFDHDKLDLTSLEGLADLINAETDAQRKQALRQAEGGLYSVYETWRKTLLGALAQLEAVIDFGEDENIEHGVYDAVYQNISKLVEALRLHSNDHRRGEIVRSGIHAAVIGPPNAGKSSLLNLLAQRQVAIVSPVAGTTRDVIESTIDIGGYPVIISDTAGLRESKDVIEIQGIKLAQQSTALLDNENPNSKPRSLTDNPDLAPLITNDQWQLSLQRGFLILNKWDLVPSEHRQGLLEHVNQCTGCPNVQPLSCLSQDGLEDLLGTLAGHFKQTFDTGAAAYPLITQVRHRGHIKECISCLETFLELEEDDVVLAAEELRHAATALGKITGKVGVEQVLDVLFSQFCIGK
ncbi:mitochondrial splicing system protein [Dispira parvispora]|uniref:Mitochondrial splicing system protein n=1 Tax=Dispira parvispora TaxID=1520584 RepID=A0A9W8ATE6_9FUNG|nr:mitochondrial splicing system protein [Dispira parvispora]